MLEALAPHVARPGRHADTQRISGHQLARRLRVSSRSPSGELSSLPLFGGLWEDNSVDEPRGPSCFPWTQGGTHLPLPGYQGTVPEALRTALRARRNPQGYMRRLQRLVDDPHQLLLHFVQTDFLL